MSISGPAQFNLMNHLLQNWVSDVIERRADRRADQREQVEHEESSDRTFDEVRRDAEQLNAKDKATIGPGHAIATQARVRDTINDDSFERGSYGERIPQETLTALPVGVRAASVVVSSPVAAELVDALAQRAVNDDANVAAAQASTAGAIGAGLMPHPGDLEALLNAAGAEQSVLDAARALALKIATKPGEANAQPQLKLQIAAARLGALEAYCGFLSDLGASTLLELVRDPNAARAPSATDLESRRATRAHA